MRGNAGHRSECIQYDKFVSASCNNFGNNSVHIPFSGSKILCRPSLNTTTLGKSGSNGVKAFGKYSGNDSYRYADENSCFAIS
jgi:hypothetical protein